MRNDRRLLRSALYVPGSYERALRKSRLLAADAVILDLEDAVAPEAKDAARRNVRAHLDKQPAGQGCVTIRVNGRGTPWFADDLAMAAQARVQAVVLPKVDGPEDLRIARDALDRNAGNAVRLWAMVETMRGLMALGELAQAARDGALGLDCLVVGTNDLAREAGTSTAEGRTYLLPWLVQIVAAARAGGIDAIDGVFNDFADRDGFARDCLVSRRCGFDGRSVIHPSQITIANAAFAPTSDEVAEAKGIVDAFSEPGKADAAIVVVGGRMVERLHLEQSKAVLARAALIERGTPFDWD